MTAEDENPTQRLRKCVGLRVLVAVDDGLPRMTVVRALAPRGQYVWLGSCDPDLDENVGWRHVSRVRVLEVFGAADETVTAVLSKLQAKEE